MSSDRPLAVVTGGSSGIGLELALQLANHGNDVALSGSSARVHDSAALLRHIGVDAWSHQADAATYEGVDSFWHSVEALGRPVEAAILNVGIARSGPFTSVALEEHLRVVAVNVTGTTHMAKRVADHMVANRGGRMMIVSSIAAVSPTPFEGVYGGTKAFGFNLAETLREELRDHGISVTALLPGATDSEFHANAGVGSDTPIGRLEKFPRAEVARLGYEAMMAGDDLVIAGAPELTEVFERNRTTPEPVKAARHARFLRPDR